MTQSKRFLPLLFVIPLLIAFGIVEGMWTDRWQPPVRVEQAAERLKGLSMTAGDWEAEDGELDERQVARAELAGYIMRRYTHRESGVTVSVFVACGKPGPIVAHRPEVCYGGAGHEQIADAVHQKIELDDQPPADFFRADFRKSNAPVAERLRIFWSWSADGEWVAANSPRLSFARYPYLYKVYAYRPTLGADEPIDQDPALDFLRVFLPQLREKLFP
jgi:hypothetical protein